MPKASPGQTSFNAGEVSPLVQGRTDAPRYKQGLAKCLNYVPALQGPLLRRPGTQYTNDVKDSTKPPTLIPFQFSATQAYMLEFGNTYIRFYANGALVVASSTLHIGVGQNLLTAFTAIRPNTLEKLGESLSVYSGTITAGNPLELVSRYNSSNDLSKLRYTQNGDTLYLFHPSYATQKLQRFGAEDWKLSYVDFQDGPYANPNSLFSKNDSFNVAMGAPVFLYPDINQTNVYNVNTQDSIPAVTATASNGGEIQVLVSAPHGFVNGQNVYVTGVGGTVEANNTASTGAGPYYWPIRIISTTEFVLIGSTYVHAYTSGGFVAPGIWGPDVKSMNATGNAPNYQRTISFIIGGKRYWGMITFFYDAAHVYVTTPMTIPNTAPASWSLGVIYQNNWPTTACFHQNRLCLAGFPNNPQQIDGSAIGSFEVFNPSDPATLTVRESDAFQYDLASSDSNLLRWLASTSQGLLSGSYVAEWAVTPSNQSEALTPTNVNALQTSFFGSAGIAPVQIGNGTFYVQRAQKKIRELHYFFQSGTFRATDMTEISEHITLPSVVQLALQKETQPLIWGLRSDGQLISMTYNRDDVSVVAGWAKHLLGGASDAAGAAPFVNCIATIPSVDLTFDQLWMVVLRYINGSQVYKIEFLTRFFDESINQEDAFFLDCGATYDNPKTITGITTANPAVVTSGSHGFSNGDQIQIQGVNGLNLSSTDVDGNVTVSNLVNGKTFVVANKTSSTFELHDFQGNNVSSVGYTSYISVGKVRKLVTTITGLTWLENETISVLADGSIHPDVVVSNSGAITLQFPAAKVQMGYKYKSQAQLLRLEAGSADGTSIGKTRRTHRAALNVRRIGDLSLGTQFTRLIPVSLAQADQNQADNAPPLFSGIIRDGLESAYDFESQICIEQNSPLPGEILSITSFLEEIDV